MRPHIYASWLATLFLWGCSDLDGDGKSGGRDCDDTNPSVHNKAEEVCDGVDNDCDGHVDEDVAIVAYLDRDGDGFGDDAMVRRVCELPANGSLVGGDCDDDASGIHPDAVEVCDGIDNDCSGEADEDVTVPFFVDADGDGSGAGPAVQTGDCWPPEGYSLDDADCDDADAARAPQLAETCDGVDNDCDQAVDEDLPDVPVYQDADGDGSGDPATRTMACGALGDLVEDGRDCDDSDPDVGAYALDIGGNGLDEDCDGYVDELGIPSLYPDLPSALVDAAPGTVVQFEDGVHAVNLDLRGHDVVLAGNGCEHTTLFGSFDGSVLQMDQGSVENVTVANGGGTPWPWAGQGTTHFGGGLFITDGHVQVSQACFESNSTNGAGGAIAVLRGGSVTVTDTTFEENASTRAGGAIFAERALVEVRRSRFLRNRSGNWRGGAIGLFGGHLDAQGSLFAHNSAEDGGATLALMPVGSNHDPNNIPELLEEPASAFLSHLTIHGSFTTANTESAIFTEGGVVEMEHSILTGTDGNLDPGNVFYLASYNRIDTGTTESTDLDLYSLGLQHAAGFEEIGFRRGWVKSAWRGDPWYVDADAGDLRLLHPSPFLEIGAFTGPFALPDADPGDTDGDGMSDLWELHHGLDPMQDDSSEDTDADGLTHLEEVLAGTDPHLPDTDADTVSDGDELLEGTNPNEPRDQRPTADAGQDRLVLVGSPVHLDSSASFDPNDDALNIFWTLTDMPVGSAATLAGASFTPDVEGVYTVVLTVDDGLAVDEHTIQVEALVGTSVATTEALQTAVADPTQTVIELQAGTYEDVYLQRGAEPLTLFGSGEVVLRPLPDHPALHGGSASLRLAQVTIEGGTQRDGLGIPRVGGGAIFWNTSPNQDDVTVTLERVDFVGASAEGNGGAVFTQGLHQLRLEDVRFEDCSADKGAALYSHTQPVQAARITAHGCDADEGILYLHTARSADDVRFEDLWLIENEARNLVHVDDTADLHLNHGLWLGNQAHRAIWFDSGSGGTTSLDGGFELLFQANAFGNDDGPLAALHGASFNAYAHEVQARDLERLFGRSTDEAQTWRTTADLRPARFIPDGVYDDVVWPRLGSSVVDAGWVGNLDLDGSRSDHAVRPRLPRDIRWKLDADADGMSDGWEVLYGLDPYADDGAEDPDGDGLANVDEHAAGTHPGQVDTDDDGVDDETEVLGGDTDPLDPFDNRPIAVLGPPQEGLFENDTILLDGSASYDPNGTPLAYHWTVLELPPGSTLTQHDLTAADTAMPGLLADARGTYRFELLVDDGTLLSEPVEIEVFVKGTLAVPDVYSIDQAFAQVTDQETIAFGDGTFEIPAVTLFQELTLTGTGATTLQAAPASRHVHVEPSGHLILEELELVGGIGTTGGAVYCDRGTFTARNVRFVGNLATYGGALYLDQCPATLLEVDIEANEALFNGGGLVTRLGEVDWFGGTLVDNISGERGGGLHADLGAIINPDKLTLSRLLIARNQASDGGAAYIRGARFDGQHLTVIENVAPNDRGGLTFVDSQPTLTSSILAFNSGPQVRLFEVLPIPEVFNGVIAWRPQDPANWYQANAEPGPAVIAADPLLLPGPRPLLLYGSPAIDRIGGVEPDGSPVDAGVYGGPHAPPDWNTHYVDLDGDQMGDLFEATYGVDDPDGDADADTLTNREEHDLGTDPTALDSDQDGVDDALEVGNSTDPADPDDNRPLAFAGFDAVVDPGVQVVLDGQFSADPNDDPLLYTWSLASVPQGSSRTGADLVPQGHTQATFTPDVPGAFVFELVVDDGAAVSEPAQVTIRANGVVRVPEDYATVAEAVSAVAPEGQVQIGHGTWEAAGLVLDGKNLSISGAGSGLTVLDAGRADRLLAGTLGEHVTLENLTTTGGRAARGGSLRFQGVTSGQPGGMRGMLELVDVELAYNHAVRGGAIYAEDADVFLTSVRLTDNGAAHEGGGVAADFVTLESAHVLWAGNHSTYADGGGLHLDRSDFFGRNLVFSDNRAGTFGGGLATDGVSIHSSFDLRFVTATHNQAVANGGFAYLRYLDDSVLSHALVVANGSNAIAKSSTAVVVDFDHSWFHDNALTDFDPALPASTTQVELAPSGLIHSDDGDWTNDTWELPTGSPASDSGDASLGLQDADGSALDPGALGGPHALPF